MKGTTILLVAGGAVMGVVAYNVLKSLQEQDAVGKADAIVEKDSKRHRCAQNSAEGSDVGSTQEQPDLGSLSMEAAVESFNQTAESASDSVGARHKEAAQMLNDIFSQMATDSIESGEKSKQVRAALEKLLKEG